jgi:hypothetical protein
MGLTCNRYALEGSPKHVLTTLATYKFSPEQIVDPMLKVLTGRAGGTFHHVPLQPKHHLMTASMPV